MILFSLFDDPSVNLFVTSSWRKPFKCNWQWENKVIPYWTEMGRFAESHNVNIAIEPHGGFSVHTPATLLKLREAVGEVIGANFDPSHVWWLGMDPV